MQKETSDYAIKEMKEDIEILKEQNNILRKKCQTLEKELTDLKRSRLFKACRYLSDLIHHPQQIIHLPGKVMRWIRRKWIPAKFPKKVNSSDPATIPGSHQKTSASSQIAPLEFKLPVVSTNHSVNLPEIKGTFRSVTVIVCVHNALKDVEECLISLWDNRTFPFELILIDDGSDDPTRKYLENYADLTHCRLIRNNIAQGYTKAANIGLRQSHSDYVILLNSDTIVTSGWVEKLIRCFEKNATAGIVSPLSNAASFQSVPETKDKDTGDWKINALDQNMTVEMMSCLVEKASKHAYPSVPVLNGFCFMIARSVIDSIGYLDEENFPRGYGEEVDYCLRATKAGFTLHVVDDTYIFHEKSKSFSHAVRKELSSASRIVLANKHGDLYNSANDIMEELDTLYQVRIRVVHYLERYKSKIKLLDKNIAFLLTARGGSGGANSVCQEVMGMRQLGIQAYVINSTNYKEEFDNNYPELKPYVIYFDKKNKSTLIKCCQNMDMVIGTIFTTVQYLKNIKENLPDMKFGYYIQDYEPLFFELGEPYYEEALTSYTLIDDICMFAKTKWIADTVEKNHHRKVHLVEPSIDTKMYNPFFIRKKTCEFPITICAMIRPKTQRRNPVGTMEVLCLLKNKYGNKLNVVVFGCTEKEIADLGECSQFEYINKGVLKRWEVADLMAHSHLFLDMSTYQAFGRTGLESMCLACVPVVPEEGGTNSYAVDGVNALVVDTKDVLSVFHRLCKLIDRLEDQLPAMQQAALNTAKDYNIMNAVYTELQLINSYLSGQLINEEMP